MKQWSSNILLETCQQPTLAQLVERRTVVGIPC